MVVFPLKTFLNSVMTKSIIIFHSFLFASCLLEPPSEFCLWREWQGLFLFNHSLFSVWFLARSAGGNGKLFCVLESGGWGLGCHQVQSVSLPNHRMVLRFCGTPPFCCLGCRRWHGHTDLVQTTLRWGWGEPCVILAGKTPVFVPWGDTENTDGCYPLGEYLGTSSPLFAPTT